MTENQEHYIRKNDEFLRESLNEIKASVNRLGAWKENVIERLARIEKSLEANLDTTKLKEEQCVECKNKIKHLEGKVSGIEIENSKEYFKTNTFGNVLKYIFIAMTGAFGSWLVSKFTGDIKH